MASHLQLQTAVLPCELGSTEKYFDMMMMAIAAEQSATQWGTLVCSYRCRREGLETEVGLGKHPRLAFLSSFLASNDYKLLIVKEG